MARYKPVSRDPLLLPVILSEQIQPGTFEFALDHLVDHELNLSALDARFCNDETGASYYVNLSRDSLNPRNLTSGSTATGRNRPAREPER